MQNDDERNNTNYHEERAFKNRMINTLAEESLKKTIAY